MFCGKCGSKIPDDSDFCGRCGAKVSRSGMTSATAAERPRGRLSEFLKSCSLILGGLVMSLLTWPMFLWFEFEIRLSGTVYSVIEDYGDLHEMRVWDKAIQASDLLGVLIWVSAAVLVAGAALCIAERKGLLRASRTRSICCIAVPAAAGVMAALATYPAIFDYIKTFDYLIH